MGKVKSKAKKSQAEVEAKKALGEAKKAAADGGKAVRELAVAGIAQLREAGLDERADELAKKLRDSDAYSELAKKLRDSDAYGKATAKGGELAKQVKDSEVADRLRDSDAAQAAAEKARAYSDETLERLGEWLGDSETGKKLGVSKRRKWPALLFGLVGVGIGYFVGTLTAPKRGADLRDDLSLAADRLAQDTADVSAPAAEKPLADKIRTRLGEDPRTSSLPKLNINVAEGTVFVRGPSENVDEAVIRDVISSVPGVKDIDLQLA